MRQEYLSRKYTTRIEDIIIKHGKFYERISGQPET
ncbi:DUF4113 domain-containing protein [Pedobacter ginsengisoli]